MSASMGGCEVGGCALACSAGADVDERPSDATGVPGFVGVAGSVSGNGVTGLRMRVSDPFCNCCKNFICAFGKPFSPTS